MIGYSLMNWQTYWNLDGFQNPATATTFNHTLSMPYSGLRIGTDGILIPNGTILPNLKGSVNDFWSAPKQIGAGFTDPEILGNCGTNCSGYDTCYIVNRDQLGDYNWKTGDAVASLSSDFSGIQIDIFTDQDAFQVTSSQLPLYQYQSNSFKQVYNCGGQNGSLALKETQGFFDDASKPRVVQKYGCVVMEVEDWIDAINQPEWQRDNKQIFGPDDEPYSLEASYQFSVK